MSITKFGAPWWDNRLKQTRSIAMPMTCWSRALAACNWIDNSTETSHVPWPPRAPCTLLPPCVHVSVSNPWIAGGPWWKIGNGPCVKRRWQIQFELTSWDLQHFSSLGTHVITARQLESAQSWPVSKSLKRSDATERRISGRSLISWIHHPSDATARCFFALPN